MDTTKTTHIFHRQVYLHGNLNLAVGTHLGGVLDGRSAAVGVEFQIQAVMTAKAGRAPRLAAPEALPVSDA
jgi:hypothetical protein